MFLYILFSLISSFKYNFDNKISINDEIFYVDLASSFKERERGLSLAKSLGEREGMLFIFKKDDYFSFWMKDTKIPLSIAFINLEGEIKEIYDLIPYSLKSISSKYKVRYALELKRGVFKEKGIKVGDKVKFFFDLPSLTD